MNETELKWLAQLRKGYLEMCVMVILRERQASYGFALMQHFKTAGVDLNEGTLYPLLNRMQKNGWLSSKWETPTNGGHPRRFYQLSETGEGLLPMMIGAFQQHQTSLSKLMEKP